MTVAAIIAEYNPFHNGHKLLIDRARAYGADRVIVLMSGDYVQRGTPAITDRETRARMALSSGADVVLAYPTRYAVSSAESFAHHAVSILNGLGAIDFLIFGSESGDLSELKACAEELAVESPEYKESLQRNLKSGMNFAKARAEALKEHSELLCAPNNILAVEYLKALTRTGSKMKPITIPREGSGYLDEETLGTLASASAIRRLLATEGTREMPAESMPASAFDILIKDLDENALVTPDDFSLPVLIGLTRHAAEELSIFQEVTPDLANTFINRRNEFSGFSDYAGVCRSRSMTESHVRRALLHIALETRKDLIPQDTHVTQVLGFRKEAADVISKIRKSASIPVLLRPHSEMKTLSGPELLLFQEEVFVSNLYESVRALKNHRFPQNVLSKELIKV